VKLVLYFGLGKVLRISQGAPEGAVSQILAFGAYQSLLRAAALKPRILATSMV